MDAIARISSKVRSHLASSKSDAKIIIAPGTSWRHQGTIDGGGTLIVGEQWAGGVHYHTRMSIPRDSRLTVTGYFRIFSGARIGLGPGAFLKVGSGYINNDARISLFHGLTLGDEVAIGPNVSFLDDDRHELVGSRRSGPITIGNRVWIGMNVTILKGVTIGDGAVIGAGSVVARDIPAGYLAHGLPAKPIRPVEWRL